MASIPTTFDLPCPLCATFSLIDDKGLSCEKCGYSTRKLPLKTAYDYGKFVFIYGHQYKHYYEEQLLKQTKLTVKGNLEPPHPLHAHISLPLLSGIVGTTSWFLVKAAIKNIVDSFNEKNETDFEIPEEDLKVLNINFREFVNNFADADPRVRNAVFEEMFAAECNTKDKEKLLSLQKKAHEAKGEEQKHLQEKATKMLDEMMRKTFKKISNTPKPTPDELSLYWLRAIE